MKHTIIALLMALCPLLAAGQATEGPFRAKLYNKDYDLWMHINFYDADIVIPGQELFGQMAGYLRREGTTYCWLMVDAKVEGDKARLVVSNDYGSEDLTAELTAQGDSIYVLRQMSGSTMKVPNKGKWQKLPKTMQFRKK